MKGEDTLNANTRRDASHGEIGCRAISVVKANHDPLERLDTLALTLADAEIDTYGVSRGELRDAGIGFWLIYLGGVHLPVSVYISANLTGRSVRSKRGEPVRAVSIWTSAGLRALPAVPRPDGCIRG